MHSHRGLNIKHLTYIFLAGLMLLVVGCGEADGAPAAKKLGRLWIGVIDLEYDSDNNPIASVVVFKP